MSPAMRRTTRTNPSTRKPILHRRFLAFWFPTIMFSYLANNSISKLKTWWRNSLFRNLVFRCPGKTKTVRRTSSINQERICIILRCASAALTNGPAGQEMSAPIQTCSLTSLFHFRSGSRRPRQVHSPDCRDEGPRLQLRRRHPPAGFQRREGQRVARPVHDARGPRGIPPRSGGGGGRGPRGRIPS